MDFIFELLFSFLQFVAELFLEIAAQALFEFGLHSIREVFRHPENQNPLLAVFGYAILGAIAGGVSLWVFPSHFITSTWLRVINFALTPLIAGVAMAGLGAWRRKRNQELVLLDRFAYGSLFAIVMTVVRFHWAH